MKNASQQCTLSDVNSFLRDHVMVTQRREIFEYCAYLFGQLTQQFEPKSRVDDCKRHLEQIEELLWQIERQCKAFASTPDAVRVFADVKLWHSFKGLMQALVSLARSGRLVAAPPAFGESSFVAAIAKLPEWQEP